VRIGFTQSREGAKEGAKKLFSQKNPPKSITPPNRFPACYIKVTLQTAINHQPLLEQFPACGIGLFIGLISANGFWPE